MNALPSTPAVPSAPSTSSPDSPQAASAAAQHEAEAREHAAYLRAQDPVNLAAVAWHTRRQDGLDAVDEAAFQHWLHTAPAHRIAYERLEFGLQVLQSLSAGERLGGAPAHVEGESSAHRRMRPTLGLGAARWFAPVRTVALYAGLVAACGIGWQWWAQQPVFSQQYATERGQRLSVPLPDGSELALDTDSHADVTLYRDRREVRLAHGQAMFNVARDRGKPFDVLSGPARVSVLGTRFSVRYLATDAEAGSVSVAVEEGRVSVTGAGAPRMAGPDALASVELSAGQTVTLNESGTVGEVVSLSPNNIAPWRKGLVSFDSAPLASALAELERYGPTGLVIHDAQVAALRIGGSYAIGRPDHFAQALPQVLPVRLEPRDGAMEIVRAW